MREFYLEFNTSPAIRMLVKAMANKFGEEKATAAISIACSRKDPPNRRLKSPACRSR